MSCGLCVSVRLRAHVRVCAQIKQGGIVKLIEKHTKGTTALDDEALRSLVQVGILCPCFFVRVGVYGALAFLSVWRSLVRLMLFFFSPGEVIAGGDHHPLGKNN